MPPKTSFVPGIDVWPWNIIRTEIQVIPGRKKNSKKSPKPTAFWPTPSSAGSMTPGERPAVRAARKAVTGFTTARRRSSRTCSATPKFQQLFQGLLREFQRSGFRASPHFVRKSFFGGKGGMLFGGLFLFGSIAGPHLLRSAKKSLPKKESLLKTVAHTVGTLLGTRQQPQSTEKPAKPTPSGNDITYITPITQAELAGGKEIQVATTGPDGQELLRVMIPAGSRAGQKLRLRGKGLVSEQGRGDLFLVLELKKS